MAKKKAVITTLGMIGNTDGKFKKFKYFFDEKILKTDQYIEHVNIFPLLIDLLSEEYEIIPLYTNDSFEKQKETLEYEGLDKKFDIKKQGRLIKEDQPEQIFNTINEILNNDQYTEVIVDVTHGFRSIPILTTVAMMIENFQNSDKIKHIIYAQVNHEDKTYTIKDLKEYLEIANIAFILTTFQKNYTLANHIKSEKYGDLINSLNNFSNDIMSLSLNNLFQKSSKNLVYELDKIQDESIKKSAQILKKHIRETFNYEGKKRFQTYFDLAKDMYDKNYMLPSLSLLFESIRMYIKSTIKKNNIEIMEDLEKQCNNNLYKIADFCKNLKWKSYEKFSSDNKNQFEINKADYNKLRKDFPKNIKKLYDEIDKTRNNLAHANADNATFKDIKKNIKKLLDEYEKECIKDKTVDDLFKHFKK